MSDGKRGLMSEPVVSQFRGINRFVNIAQVPPDNAVDLLNVVCSLGGGLTPLRQPKSITGAVDTTGNFVGTCYGMYNYQRADGIRQIITVWGTKIWALPAFDGVWQAPILVDDDPDNAHFWSMVDSTNVLFMANGSRMIKWDGQTISQWGMRRPTKVPVVGAVNDGAGDINLTTGRKYRAAFKNSVTGGVSSSSDPSDTSGPATNATIDVSIDAVADAAADPQIDTVVWYATQDDGTEYYYHSEVAIDRAAPTQLVDDLLDPGFEGKVDQPTISVEKDELCDVALQTPIGAAYWQRILAFGGFPQWRTVGPNPPAGIDLPIMYAHDFGFAIPANAKITGVALRFDAANEAATTNYVHQVALYKTNAVDGVAKTFANTDFILPHAADTWYEFGEDGEMWGATLTPDDVNDPTFGFGVTIKYVENGAGQRVFLFGFQMIVYYVIPVTINPGNPLTTNRNAPLLNDPPPLGKYLATWGGRIFVAGLKDSPQDVVYSGYEAILDGRPEEAFPPGNRLRLAVGADWVRGMGVVQAGLVLGSKSNEMFMFRGEVEDVVTGTPLAFTELLETLPFSTGFASHYAIVSTPDGITFLSAQRSIDQYSGVARPDSMSLAIADLLGGIPAGLEEACIGTFYNYLEKDWYVLAVPYGVGATRPNRIIIIDLDASSESSTGIFIFDIGTIDALAIVEEPGSGRPMIVVAQAGELREIKAVVSGTNVLQVVDAADATPVTRPYWAGGYHGNETPQISKMWRHAYVITDGGGGAPRPPLTAGELIFQVTVSLVNDANRTFRAPLTMNPTLATGGKATINWKAKRAALKILFPRGVACSVLQMWLSRIPTSER